MRLAGVTAALTLVLAMTSAAKDDTAPPRLLMEGLRTCILSHTCFLYVESSEDATLVGTGRAVIRGSGRTFRFKRIQRRVRAKEEYELSFALRRRARRAVGRALRQGRRVAAYERVRVTDEAGNTRVRTRSVPIVLD